MAVATAIRGRVEPILPAGGTVGAMKASPPIVKQYSETAPEVQGIIDTLFGIYTARGPEQLSKVFDSFQFNCVFDLALIFARGADRMRVMTNLLTELLDIEVRPRLVQMQLLENNMACIDVEAELRIQSRMAGLASWLPIIRWVMPSPLHLHGTWTIVTAGDEKIISMTEQLHNLPGCPRLLRAVGTTLVSTVGLTFGGW